MLVRSPERPHVRRFRKLSSRSRATLSTHSSAMSVVVGHTSGIVDAAHVPPDVAAAVNAVKAPPREDASALRIRHWSIVSFWLVAALLGLPLWWRTTTVYRASLPMEAMNNWAEGKVGSISQHETQGPLTALLGLQSRLSD